MNYIGSKHTLLSFLDESINQIVDKDCTVFCDLFAGTGAVGAFFKKKGYKIISNDIQHYSYVLNKQYIGNHKVLSFTNLYVVLPDLQEIDEHKRKDFVCEYLSRIIGEKGFIFNNYCPSGTSNSQFSRMYFTDFNGKKCDAIRTEIENWFSKKYINENEYYYLLATLIENIDKLANTASVYGAYLKQFKKSAQKELMLNPIELIINDSDHEVYCEDINVLIKKIKGDILYLDPPYNQRQYATNYHILETISKYDNPEIFGKTGLREYSKQKSLFCQKGKVLSAFSDLILNADMRYIFLSYNNEGIMSHNEIKEIMSKRGKYGYFIKDYSRFKADKTENRNHIADKTTEYLHYVIVDNKAN
jgi:adenine-specific DNA-methyltransferase